MSNLTKKDFITLWTLLGKELMQWTHDEDLLQEVVQNNPWFIKSEVIYALQSLSKMLQPNSIEQWVNSYNLPAGNSKTIGVVMAGNIPMVGFHDWLCVLTAGHTLQVKYSSQDSVLMKKLKTYLQEIAPKLGERIVETERIHKVEAVIATGSNNTARYFDYYFRNIPHVIRKNRNSVAIVTGSETSEQLVALGADVFRYFGMGCRNVSKLMIPEGFDVVNMLSHWECYASVADFHKYFNNYEYRKAILLVNQDAHYDTGFLLLKEDARIASPVSMLHYEIYTSLDSCKELIAKSIDEIQCVVSVAPEFKDAVLPGEAQIPGLRDYADGVDIMKFLLEDLNN